MFFGIPAVGEAQKNGSERLNGIRGISFLIFLKIPKYQQRIIQIWIFLKHFKCEGIFLSSSLDSLHFSASRDVFCGSPGPIR